MAPFLCYQFYVFLSRKNCGSLYTDINDDSKHSLTQHNVDGNLKEFQLKMAELTPDEKDIILKGCLINYYRGQEKNVSVEEKNTQVEKKKTYHQQTSKPKMF